MKNRESYEPGAAAGAEIRKDGEKWTLVLVRDLRQAPAMVWKALTDPEHLREWAPFDSDRSLGSVGTVMLSTVGTPTPRVSESHVKRADAPRLLELDWGGQDLRWELEPLGNCSFGSCIYSKDNMARSSNRYRSYNSSIWSCCC